jgi:hypothetical protein
VAELGCFFADGPVSLEAEVLSYTPALLHPRSATPPLLYTLPHNPNAGARLHPRAIPTLTLTLFLTPTLTPDPHPPPPPLPTLTQVLFYTPAQCPPREACVGRRLVCVPHYPRATDGTIDVEALRNLPPRELTGRPLALPARATPEGGGAERLSSAAGVLALVIEAVARAFGGSVAADALDAETDLFEAGP